MTILIPQRIRIYHLSCNEQNKDFYSIFPVMSKRKIFLCGTYEDI